MTRKMTRKEALKVWHDSVGFNEVECSSKLQEAISTAFRELEKGLKNELTHPKIKTCKDCKWWKDSDGVYRRSMSAESQCPMNRKEVYEGNGYCFLFEPRESKEGAKNE